MAAKRKKATAQKTRNDYITIPSVDGGEIKLTKKRADFARLFALYGDATKARLEAGFSNNPTINHGEAYKLLQYKEVQQAIEYYRAELAKKLDISENRILAEIAALAFSNLADCEDEDGTFKPLQKMKPETQRAIKTTAKKRYLEGGGEDGEMVEIQKYEMHPKLQALKLLCEIKGMLKQETDKNAKRQTEVTIKMAGLGQ